ncbi:MAG: CDP-diacylglycerol--glycerol-3-phosphate 3-phosphatidyltransferase [Pseudomonadota bacterium]
MNIPNMLTVSRILLMLVMMCVFYMPFQWVNYVTAGLFAIASVTDWLDGYLARRWEQSTPLGAFLDPVADKLTVALALVLLVEQHHVWWFTLPAVIIISREIIISALREWMAELGKRTSVAVSYIGKVKTALQMISILLLLFAHEQYEYIHTLGMVLLYAAVILTVWSMFKYLYAAKDLLLAD